MRKTIFKWLILIFLFTYVAVVTVWAHGEAVNNACTGVDVEIASEGGIDTITSKGVEYELSRFTKKITGVPLEKINTLKIERYLSGFSNFEDVECALTTDGRLSVKVVPMVPEIRVFDNGSSYYLNKDGKKILSKSNFFVDVPVVEGSFSEEFSSSSLLPLMRFIKNDPVLRDLVGMVHATGPRDIFLIPRINGHVVNFGDTSRLGEKRAALLSFYHKVIPYKGWETYDTISVKFRGQVVASKHNKPKKIEVDLSDDDISLEEATLPTDFAPAPTASQKPTENPKTSPNNKKSSPDKPKTPTNKP